MLNWIKEYKSIFRLKGLEKEMKIPVDSLRKSFSENNKQELSEKWKPEIYRYLKKFYNSLGEVLKNYEQNKK